MKRGLRLTVVNQKKRGTASSTEQKSASSSVANKKRAIYVVLHVSTIQIGELVGKASAPVKVCPISLNQISSTARGKPQSNKLHSNLQYRLELLVSVYIIIVLISNKRVIWHKILFMV